MDSIVFEVTKSQTRLSGFHFTCIVRTESWAEDLGQKSQLIQGKQKPSIYIPNVKMMSSDKLYQIKGKAA